VFWRSETENVLPHQHHSDLTAVLEEEWLKIPLATSKDFYLSLQRQTDAFCCKRRPYTILINYCGLKPGVSMSLSKPIVIAIDNV